jgi:hypothetical protein
MTPEQVQQFDEAVEKLAGAILMLTARVDPQIIAMSLFKVYEKVTPNIKNIGIVNALADDFEDLASKIRITKSMTIN